MRIALATCATLPEPDPDEHPLLSGLRASGHDAESVAWDDPEEGSPDRLASFDAVILRATWNYHHDLPRFLRWVDAVAERTRLTNGAATVRWNADKRYLADLESRGVPIVPTVWPVDPRSNAGNLPPNAAVDTPGDLIDRAMARGWSDLVVKPVVSAGSFMTRRFALVDPQAEADARAFAASALSGRPMMAQRYMRSVTTSGERSLVWITGEITHAIHKHPRFDDAEEFVEPATIADDERDFAARAVDAATNALGGERPFYARVDVMRDDDGSLRLAELELIEPSLFFDLGPAGLERFVESVVTLGANAV